MRSDAVLTETEVLAFRDKWRTLVANGGSGMLDRAELREFERAVLTAQESATVPLSPEEIDRRALEAWHAVEGDESRKLWPNESIRRQPSYIAAVRALSGLRERVGREVVTAQMVHEAMAEDHARTPNAPYRRDLIASHINAALGLRASGGGESWSTDALNAAVEAASRESATLRERAEKAEQVATARLASIEKAEKARDTWRGVAHDYGQSISALRSSLAAQVREGRNADGSARTFTQELTALLNRFNRESPSNTPDFILAEFLTNVLGQVGVAIGRRDQWYGVRLAPGQSRPAASSAGETGTDVLSAMGLAQPPFPVVCHAPGPKCLGCAHKQGKAPRCDYADTPDPLAALREQVERLEANTAELAKLCAAADETHSGVHWDELRSLARRIRGAE